jgi:hypothetical protein
MKQYLYQDMTTKCNGCNRYIEVPAGKEYDFSKPIVCGICWWEGKDTIEKEPKNE